jgi:hypothetical protein
VVVKVRRRVFVTVAIIAPTEVARMAKNLKIFRKTIPVKVIHYGWPNDSPVLCSSAVNVIECQEFKDVFITAGTLSPVGFKRKPSLFIVKTSFGCKGALYG